MTYAVGDVAWSPQVASDGRLKAPTHRGWRGIGVGTTIYSLASTPSKIKAGQASTGLNRYYFALDTIGAEAGVQAVLRVCEE